MVEETIKLKLTIPPSLNKLFAWYRVRHKSDDYKDWIRKAVYELSEQKQYSITGDNWLIVNYIYYTPLYFKNGKIKKIDVFNYEKALSDLLEKSIPGFQDEKIRIGRVEKINSTANIVEIEIKEEKKVQNKLDKR